MKYKDLKINFRYLTGNIACLSVDSISGESVHNDINNEEAIIIFNSLVGEKADCQTVKSLLKENQELNDKINKAIDFYETYKQECVIGRTRDEKLIKDYYLPAQLSKDLIKILKGEYNVKQRIKRKIR